MVEIVMSDRQIECFAALARPEITEVLYGGAKGGAKSVCGCLWMYDQALEIINRYELYKNRTKANLSPLRIGWMGRAVGKDFKETTLETWKRFVPAGHYVIKEQAQEIVIRGVVKVGFGGLDNTEQVAKFNSAEFARIFVDQAEETEEREVGELRAALNRMTINGMRVPGKILFTANPRNCWLKQEFIDNRNPWQAFIPALPTDNPWVGAEYIKTLERTFRNQPELLAAYRDGRWDVMDQPAQLIRSAWLDAAGRRYVCSDTARPPFRLVAIDPARFGDDEAVIYGMEDTEILKRGESEWEAEFHRGLQGHQLAHAVLSMARRIRASVIVVDGTGATGSGVIDPLTRISDIDVLEVVSSARASHDDEYVNLRSEMWFDAANEFGDGSVGLHYDDAALRAQLLSPTYDFRGKRQIVEDKSAIKKRLGRSPDRADAYILGLYGLRWLRKKTVINSESVRLWHGERVTSTLDVLDGQQPLPERDPRVMDGDVPDEELY